MGYGITSKGTGERFGNNAFILFLIFILLYFGTGNRLYEVNMKKRREKIDRQVKKSSER